MNELGAFCQICGIWVDPFSEKTFCNIVLNCPSCCGIPLENYKEHLLTILPKKKDDNK